MALAWIGEFLADANVAHLGADVLDQLLWSGTVESDNPRAI
jgi:hypothetical protein